MTSGRYQRPSTTKDSQVSWLGRIPSSWELKRFKNLFRIRKRIAGKLGFDILSITQKGIRKKDTTSGDGQLSMDYTKYQIVQPGDFAMNHMDLLTGFVDISEHHGVTSPDYRVFTLEDRESDPRFHLYLLQLCYIAKIFYPLGQGAAQVGRWRLPSEAFNEFVGPVPTFAEQTQIAAFLDHETAKIDRLIEKQQALISLLKEKRQAVISHAVTKGLNPHAALKNSGIPWLGQVPAHWAIKPLLTVAAFSPGKAHEPFIDDDGKYVCVNSRFVSTGGESRKLCTRNITPAAPNDILMVMSDLPNGRALAKAYFVTGETNLAVNQRVCAITAIDGAPRFLYYFLDRNAGFLLHDDGVSQTHLSNANFTKLPTLVPPKQEQHSIADFLDQKTRKINELVRKAELAVEVMQERRTALISAAVTGKIDVRDWQPPSSQAN